MKRSERRELEKELRLLAMEETKLDPERDAQIIARAKEQYEQTRKEETKEPVRGNRIGRRVLIVSATAMALMVLSFAYTVLMPDSVSSAKNFVHRATIWVSNALHLGIEVEVPPEGPTQGSTEDAVYYSLEEAAANLPYPLVYLDHPDVELQSVMVLAAYQYPEAALSYRYESADINIYIAFIGEDYYTKLNTPDGKIIPWKEGELACWNLDVGEHAFTYYAGLEISIDTKDDLSFDTFTDLCRYLTPFI